MKKFVSALLLGIFTISNMAAQTGHLFLNFELKYNQDPLTLNSEINLADNRGMELSRLDFYLSNIVLLKGDDLTEEAIPESYILLKNNDSYEHMNFTFESLDMTDVRGIRMFVGIDSTTNHEDPSLYVEEHPLALQSPSMHWGWSGGYRFLALNGIVDHDMDLTVDKEVAFEVVGDNFYQSFDLMFDEAQNGTTALNIELQFDKLLEDINMETALILHGAGEKLDAIVDNMISNDFFVLDQSSLSLETIENDLVVFVNGTTKSIYVKSEESLTSFTIYNEVGQVILGGKLDGTIQLHEISMTHIKSGVYFLLLAKQDGQTSNHSIVNY